MPEIIPENDAYEMASKSLVRLMERISEFVARWLIERREGEREEEFGDFKSNSGVRSLVMASVTVSVTPVVRAEGFGASSAIGGVLSEGDSERGVIVRAVLRLNRYSVKCVCSHDI